MSPERLAEGPCPFGFLFRGAINCALVLSVSHNTPFYSRFRMEPPSTPDAAGETNSKRARVAHMGPMSDLSNFLDCFHSQALPSRDMGAAPAQRPHAQTATERAEEVATSTLRDFPSFREEGSGKLVICCILRFLVEVAPTSGNRFSNDDILQIFLIISGNGFRTHGGNV